MPPPESLRTHYEHAETYRTWQSDERLRRALWRKRLDLVHRFARSGGRLLDVGTGDAHFASLASSRFMVSSTEISSAGIEAAGLRGVRPRRGTLETIDFRDEVFDVITLWHVLEHLPSPATTLDRLHELLAPGGVLIIAAPNETRHLHARQLENEVCSTVSSDDEIHLYFWTPSSLRNALATRGWDVVHCGVDDVHIVRNPWIVAKYQFNRLLASLTGWHFDPAMAFVCRETRGTSVEVR